MGVFGSNRTRTVKMGRYISFSERESLAILRKPIQHEAKVLKPTFFFFFGATLKDGESGFSVFLSPVKKYNACKI